MIFPDHGVNIKVVDNVENYRNMKFQPKIFTRSWENAKKPHFWHIFWCDCRMQKSLYSLYKSCRQWPIECIYEFSAESSHTFSKKKIRIFRRKSGFVTFTFLHLEQANLLQKSRKSNDRKYENFCDWLTDGRTDGPGYIGPVCGSKNQKKLMLGSRRTFVTDRWTDGWTDGAGFIRTLGES